MPRNATPPGSGRTASAPSARSSASVKGSSPGAQTAKSSCSMAGVRARGSARAECAADGALALDRRAADRYPHPGRRSGLARHPGPGARRRRGAAPASLDARAQQAGRLLRGPLSADRLRALESGEQPLPEDQGADTVSCDLARAAHHALLVARLDAARPVHRAGAGGDEPRPHLVPRHRRRHLAEHRRAARREAARRARSSAPTTSTRWTSSGCSSCTAARAATSRWRPSRCRAPRPAPSAASRWTPRAG